MTNCKHYIVFNQLAGRSSQSTSLCFHRVQSTASPFGCPLAYCVHAARREPACTLLPSALSGQGFKTIREDLTRPCL